MDSSSQDFRFLRLTFREAEEQSSVMHTCTLLRPNTFPRKDSVPWGAKAQPSWQDNEKMVALLVGLLFEAGKKKLTFCKPAASFPMGSGPVDRAHMAYSIPNPLALSIKVIR